MDTGVSKVVVCEKKKRNRGRRRPFVPPLKRSKKPGRRGGEKGRRRKLKRLGLSPSVRNHSGAEPVWLPSPDQSLVIDLATSDEDIPEPPPGSPAVEEVDVDACVRVRFAEEVPDEVLESLLRHRAAGQGADSHILCSTEWIHNLSLRDPCMYTSFYDD